MSSINLIKKSLKCIDSYLSNNKTDSNEIFYYFKKIIKICDTESFIKNIVSLNNFNDEIQRIKLYRLQLLLLYKELNEHDAFIEDIISQEIKKFIQTGGSNSIPTQGDFDNAVTNLLNRLLDLKDLNRDITGIFNEINNFFARSTFNEIIVQLDVLLRQNVQKNTTTTGINNLDLLQELKSLVNKQMITNTDLKNNSSRILHRILDNGNAIPNMLKSQPDETKDRLDAVRETLKKPIQQVRPQLGGSNFTNDKVLSLIIHLNLHNDIITQLDGNFYYISDHSKLNNIMLYLEQVYEISQLHEYINVQIVSLNLENYYNTNTIDVGTFGQIELAKKYANDHIPNDVISYKSHFKYSLYDVYSNEFVEDSLTNPITTFNMQFSDTSYDKNNNIIRILTDIYYMLTKINIYQQLFTDSSIIMEKIKNYTKNIYFNNLENYDDYIKTRKDAFIDINNFIFIRLHDIQKNSLPEDADSIETHIARIFALTSGVMYENVTMDLKIKKLFSSEGLLLQGGAHPSIEPVQITNYDLISLCSVFTNRGFDILDMIYDTHKLFSTIFILNMMRSSSLETKVDSFVNNFNKKSTSILDEEYKKFKKLITDVIDRGLAELNKIIDNTNFLKLKNKFQGYKSEELKFDMTHLSETLPTPDDDIDNISNLTEIGIEKKIQNITIKPESSYLLKKYKILITKQIKFKLFFNKLIDMISEKLEDNLIKEAIIMEYNEIQDSFKNCKSDNNSIVIILALSKLSQKILNGVSIFIKERDENDDSLFSYKNLCITDNKTGEHYGNFLNYYNSNQTTEHLFFGNDGEKFEKFSFTGLKNEIYFNSSTIIKTFGVSGSGKTSVLFGVKNKKPKLEGDKFGVIERLFKQQLLQIPIDSGKNIDIKVEYMICEIYGYAHQSHYNVNNNNNIIEEFIIHKISDENVEEIYINAETGNKINFGDDYENIKYIYDIITILHRLQIYTVSGLINIKTYNSDKFLELANELSKHQRLYSIIDDAIKKINSHEITQNKSDTTNEIVNKQDNTILNILTKQEYYKTITAQVSSIDQINKFIEKNVINLNTHLDTISKTRFKKDRIKCMPFNPDSSRSQMIMIIKFDILGKPKYFTFIDKAGNEPVLKYLNTLLITDSELDVEINHICKSGLTLEHVSKLNENQLYNIIANYLVKNKFFKQLEFNDDYKCNDTKIKNTINVIKRIFNQLIKIEYDYNYMESTSLNLKIEDFVKKFEHFNNKDEDDISNAIFKYLESIIIDKIKSYEFYFKNVKHIVWNTADITYTKCTIDSQKIHSSIIFTDNIKYTYDILRGNNRITVNFCVENANNYTKVFDKTFSNIEKYTAEVIEPIFDILLTILTDKKIEIVLETGIFKYNGLQFKLFQNIITASTNPIPIDSFKPIREDDTTKDDIPKTKDKKLTKVDDIPKTKDKKPNYLEKHDVTVKILQKIYNNTQIEYKHLNYINSQNESKTDENTKNIMDVMCYIFKLNGRVVDTLEKEIIPGYNGLQRSKADNNVRYANIAYNALLRELKMIKQGMYINHINIQDMILDIIMTNKDELDNYNGKKLDDKTKLLQIEENPQLIEGNDNSDKVMLNKFNDITIRSSLWLNFLRTLPYLGTTEKASKPDCNRVFLLCTSNNTFKYDSVLESLKRAQILSNLTVEQCKIVQTNVNPELVNLTPIQQLSTIDKPQEKLKSKSKAKAKAELVGGFVKKNGSSDSSSDSSNFKYINIKYQLVKK